MASPLIVFAACLAAILFFSCIGLALGRWIGPSWAPPASIAPALGWGVFSAVSFPLQDLFGFTQASMAVLALAALAASLAALALGGRAPAEPAARLPAWALLLAALVAAIPLAALLPRPGDGGIIIGATAFDHSKIAMVDEMTRLGLPAGNPFFGAFGARSALSYYFLWHFGAAQLSILSGVSGWEADAAMTGFTAYASLLLMMGLAGGLCAGLGQGPAVGKAGAARPGAARPDAAMAWVAVISLTGSLRPLLGLMLGAQGLDRLLSHYRGLAGWMVQASWVPQHMASACCMVLFLMLLADVSRRPRAGMTPIMGALAAAGFGSSAWVGGVTFALCAAAAGLVGLWAARSGQRVLFALIAAASAAIALGLALPLLHAEFGTLTARRGGSPIGLHPYEVVGAWAPAPLGRWLDLPAYWLLLLPIELPAIYLVGMATLALRAGQALRPATRDPHVLMLAAMTLASLATAWLLVSTIGNNDLGWRAILPAVLALTAITAASLARWIGRRAWGALACAVALVALGGPDQQVFQNVHGRPSDDAPQFADAPALWTAVRRYAGPTDRVANNPQSLNGLTDWPVNPSWALLSNRPSCFSGWETARAYVDLPTARIAAIDAQFNRVFDGKAAGDDVRQMAQDYGCRVVAVVPDDGAWTRDPFAASPYYRLAEQRDDQWRIYAATRPVSAAPASGR